MTEFFEALIIILREGLEAILIIAAIITYLVKTKHANKVKTVYLWAGLAIIASIVTALVIDQAFAASKASQEFLEGITMLLAAGVMLYVTNWILGKLESEKWGNYIKGKMDDALTSKNTIALGLVSFLAVYREGFETVLFFKALTLGTTDLTGVLSGLIVGLVILVILFYLIIRVERKLPINIVFGITSGLLFLLSLKFAGKGIHELQEVGIIPETALAIVPKIKDLGIYPTMETLGIQTIVILFGAAMLYFHFFKNQGKD